MHFELVHFSARREDFNWSNAEGHLSLKEDDVLLLLGGLPFPIDSSFELIGQPLRYFV